MTSSQYACALKDEIAAHYRYRCRKGYRPLGWRFLYSPARVVDGAELAFLGLNPGGDHIPPDHPWFATEDGSAYETERWSGHEAGRSPLQRQVLELFRRIGVEPSAVLAGNLVPFRSPKWACLEEPKGALGFAESIWRCIILDRARPRMVVAMGGETRRTLKRLFRISKTERVGVNWGTSEREVKAECGEFATGRFVGLPHLSRYPIVTREASTQAVDRLVACLTQR